MVNIKVNLTILLQGGTMVSEGDCSKEVKRPVINKRGKYAGKQKRDKEGSLVFETAFVPDPKKMDHHTMKLSYRDEATKKTVTERINYYTRKCNVPKQSINICEEAFKYMTGTEVPEGFKFPIGFKPNKTLLKKGVSAISQAWNIKSKKEKLEWHLHQICEGLGGKLGEYVVFND